ncbi:MAG TPA: GxxExxY protein [Bacteroidia bacterium]|jgi:GxxExxY protein|nr:GxxExxY protein [Bacteroidia bacterium]
MTENDLSYAIRGAAFKVYNELGPGLLESIYEAALKYELQQLGIRVESQLPIPVEYKEVRLELGFRLDLLVGEKVIVEIKSVETISPVHYKILLSYLRLANKKLGLLINFSSDNLAGDIKRIINGKL